MKPEHVPQFPVVVDDLNTIRYGSHYVADLVAEGPTGIGMRAFMRAIHTLAREFRRVSLTELEIRDWYTTLVTYADDELYQFELCYGDGRLGDRDIKSFEPLQHPESAGLVVITTTNRVAVEARAYCYEEDIALLQLNQSDQATSGSDLWRSL